MFKLSYFLEFFGVTEVYSTSRLLQTVLFLTDSVFYVLFACFDESMGFIGGYEPWWSGNTVYIMLIWNWNEFTTVPKGSDLLYYTNGSHKVFVKVLCGWSVRRSRSYQYEKNKERQEFKLGDAQGTPSKYFKGYSSI